MGPKVDEVLCPRLTGFCLSQHPQDLRKGSATSVRHFHLRPGRHLFVHRRDDCQDAHSRDTEGIIIIRSSLRFNCLLNWRAFFYIPRGKSHTWKTTGVNSMRAWSCSSGYRWSCRCSKCWASCWNSVIPLFFEHHDRSSWFASCASSWSSPCQRRG